MRRLPDVPSALRPWLFDARSLTQRIARQGDHVVSGAEQDRPADVGISDQADKIVVGDEAIAEGGVKGAMLVEYGHVLDGGVEDGLDGHETKS